MSEFRSRKFKIIVAVFLLSGSFLFLGNLKKASADLHNNYTKAYNGTLASTEWNNLPLDFLNKIGPAFMDGPLGIGTGTPAFGLEVNGPIKATNFTGSVTGQIDAANVMGGNGSIFGSNTGGGNYSFPASVGIGTTNATSALTLDTGKNIRMNGGAIRFKDTTGYIWQLADAADTTTYAAGIYWDTSNKYLEYRNYYGAINLVPGVGGSANTGLFIKNDGNVGIGTTAPGTKMETYGGDIYANASSIDGIEMATGWISSGSHKYETFNTTGSVITAAANTTAYACADSNALSVTAGKTYRISFLFTLNSGTGPISSWIRTGTDSNGTNRASFGPLTSSGAKVFYFTAPNTETLYFGIWTDTGVINNFSISGFSIKESVGGNVITKGQILSYGTGNNYFAGSIGIGTTNSLAALQARGLVALSLPASSGVTQTGVISRFQGYGTNGTLDFGNAGGGISWIQSTNITDLSLDYVLLLNPNGGNISIGATTTPTKLLEVNGMAKFYNFAYGTTPLSTDLPALTTVEYVNGLINSSTSTVGIKWTKGGDTVGALKTFGTIDAYDLPFITSNAERMRILAGGNVGIGTTTPAYKLDIFGGIARQSGYLFSDAATDNLLVNGDFEMGDKYGWNTGSVVSGGYAGNYTLQITGAANLTNDDYIPVDPTKDIFQLDAWVKKTVAGATPGLLYFGYYAYDANKAIITSPPCGTYCYFAASGYVIPVDGVWHKVSATTVGEGTVAPNFPIGTRYVKILGLVNYGGSADSVAQVDHISLKRLTKGPLIAGNNFSSTNLTDNNQYSTLYTNATNNLIVNSSGNVIISASGNFGVGTTNPLVKTTLDQGLYGLPAATSTVQTYASLRLQAGSSGNVVLDMGSAGGSSGTWLQTTNKTDLSQVYPLLLNPNGGLVGIGTTNPGKQLEVAGTGQAKFNSFAYGTTPASTDILALTTVEFVKGLIDSSTSTVGMKWSKGGDTVGSLKTLGTLDSFDLPFITSNTEKMRILAGGNVGIGTIAPNSKLHVSGTLEITSSAAENHFYNVLSYYVGSANQTGTLKIVMPKSWSSTMLNIVIRGYNWSSSNGAWEANVGGYNYGSSQVWLYTNAKIDGPAPFTQIRLAHDGNKNVILLGNTSTVWSYATVEVTDVLTTFSGQSDWGTNWSASLITDESAIASSTTPTIYTYTNGSGYFGVGTTNPAVKLHVYGNGTYSAAFMNGSVGIGTTTPTKLLEVNGQAKFNSFAYGTTPLSTDLPALTTVEYVNGLINSSTSTVGMKWSKGGDTVGSIKNLGTIDAFDLPFITGNTERMRILAGGNVGIGTTAPSNKLTVTQTSSNLYDSAILIGETSSGENNRLYIGTDTDGAYFRTDYTAGGNLSQRFYTFNTERMRIDGGGNVGIGTSAPTNAKLQISGSGTYDSVLRLSNIGSNGGDYFLLSSNDSWTAGANKLLIGIGTPSSANTKLVLDSTGSVGIGTTTPSKQLEVAGTGQAKFNSFSYGTTPSSTDLPALTTVEYVNGLVGGSSWTQGGNTVIALRNLGTLNNYDLPFITSSTERMRITNVGNVGIGTTTPGNKLHIYGGASGGTPYELANGSLTLERNGRTSMQFLSPNTSDQYIFFGDPQAANRAWVGYDHNIDQLLLHTGSTIYMDGNVGIGTSSPSLKLDVVGRGAFGSMAASRSSYGNTLSLVNTGASDTSLFLWQNGVASGHIGFSSGSNLLRIVNSTSDGLLTSTSSINITSSGSLGVGTTNPGKQLEVAGTGQAKFNSFAYGTTPASTDILALTTVEFVKGLIDSSTSTVGMKWSKGGDTVGSLKTLGTLDSFDLPFITSNTEKMRILASGNVGIGITNPGYKLDVSGTTHVSNTLTLDTPVAAQNGVNLQNLTITSDPYTSQMIFGYDYDALVNADKRYTVTLGGGFSGSSANLFDGNTGSSLAATIGSTGTIEVNLGNMQHYFYGLVLTSPWGTSYGFSSSFLIEKYYDTHQGTGGWDSNCDNSEGGMAWATVADVTGFSGRQYVTRSGLGNGICKIRVTFRDVVGSQNQIQVGDLSMYQFYSGYKGLNAKTNGDMLFGDYDFSDGATRVHIDNSTGVSYFNGGNFGVGTTNPAVKFHVYGNGTYSAAFMNGAVGISTTTPSKQLEVAGTGQAKFNSFAYGTTPSSTDLPALTTVEYVNGLVGGSSWTQGGNTVIALRNLGTLNNYDLPFITSSTERMRITNVGNVGIGTTTPAVKFHVYGNGTYAAAFTNGSVGIGVTNPVQRLQVIGGIYANSGYHYVDNNYGFVSNDGKNGLYPDTASGLIFKASSTEFMRINQSGNVGIGTTNPTDKLNVSGGDVQITGSGNSSYYKSNDTTNGVSVWFGVSSAARGFIGTISNHSLGFRTNNADRLLIDTTGAVGIGTTTPTKLLEVNGQAKFNSFAYGLTPITSDPYALATVEYVNGFIGTSTVNNKWSKGGDAVGLLKNFGTLDSFDLPFITSSTERMRILAGGNVGI